MFKREDGPFCALDLLSVGRQVATVALCLSMASLTLAGQPAAHAGHASAAEQEGSVLIATRDAAPERPLVEAAPHDIEPGTPGADEVCEAVPQVSQSSDHSPDLANPPKHDDASTTFDN